MCDAKRNNFSSFTQAVQVVGVSLHHFPALFQILGTVVGLSDPVFRGVRQLPFNGVPIPALLGVLLGGEKDPEGEREEGKESLSCNLHFFIFAESWRIVSYYHDQRDLETPCQLHEQRETRMPLTTMSGEEFVEKLSEGEKDFTKIHIKPGTVLDETALKEVGHRLRQAYGLDTPAPSPLVLSGSELKNISAKYLCMPQVKASETVFDYSDLHGADFDGADFWDSSFLECNLYSSNFSQGHLGRVIFEKADLRQAHFLGTELQDINFRYSDMRFGSFFEAYLKRVDCSFSDLRGTLFYSTRIEGVRTFGAKLGVGGRLHMTSQRFLGVFDRWSKHPPRPG